MYGSAAVRHLRTTIVILLVALSVGLNDSPPCRGQEAPRAEDFANASIAYLAPADFKGVPAHVRQRLESDGCIIPQASLLATGRTNLVHGELARKGQIDWAALCSKNGTSVVEMVWGGSVRCPDRLNPSRDRDWLQAAEKSEGQWRIDFSRLLRVVDYSDLIDYASPPAPGSMDHQGLEAAFAGKASSVYYCTKGRWVTVAGAD